MTSRRKSVSIIIPIFNEQDGVGQLKEELSILHRLLCDQFDVEFVFVDDGSSDNTVSVIKKEFTDSPYLFRVLEHGINRGVGAAFRTGFEAAKAAFVCTIDADCSYSPEGLKKLLEALQSTGADIAVASPYHPQGKVEGVPGWRLALSKGCSLLYRLTSPVKLYTYTSIFRAYRGEVTGNLRFAATGFVAAAEILVEASRKGYTIVEIPMVLRGRAIGRSKMKIARTILTHFRMLMNVGFSRESAPVPPQLMGLGEVGLHKN